MSINTKIFSILIIFTALLLIATQCGTAQPQQAAQSSQQTEMRADEEHQKEHKDDSEVHGEEGEAHDKDEEHHHEDEYKHDEAIELSAINLANGEKLKVLATTNIVGDLVRNVGGDRIELTIMLPIGADPHTFVPTPQDTVAVADAQVVFINGLHLEEFLEELIENAGGEAPTVSLATHVKIREFEALIGEAHGHDEDNHEEEKHDEEAEEPDEDEEDLEEEEEGHDEDEPGHAHEGADPHIWMTPANAVVMVHNIESALSRLDPANAETYEANAEAYEAQLEELDAWVKSQIESVPVENRELVTDHEALGYYTDRYGLEVVGTVLPANNTGAEPSAQELAELQEVIQKVESKAVFVGTTVNPVLAARVAEDTNIKLIPLYTGSLGEAGSGVETYLDFIRYNTIAIVEALQ